MKVLIVTYYFPPVGGVGVQRVLKWIKYFPKFGIEPIILTNKHGLGLVQDDSLLHLDYLKQIKTYRVGGKKLKKYHLLKKQGRLYSFHNILLLVRYILGVDIFSSWFQEIKKDVVEITKNEQIECILTTSPPHSTHLFGSYVKDNTKIPWIMDLRDPMVSWPGRTGWLDLTIQKLIEPKFEKLFYSKADSVVFVTKHSEQEAIKRCPLSLERKTHVIRNGYDTDDFVNEVKTTRSSSHDKFNITYTGTLRPYHNAEPFIRALISLLEKNFSSRNEIVVRIIGNIVSGQRSLFLQLPSNSVEFVDTVSHKEAIKYQMTADLLLLFLPEDFRGTGANVLAGKVYEYIGASKPIFALAPEGELANLIRENQLGYVADPGKPEDVEAALLTAYQNWKHGVNIISSENREQFTRESQCQNLSHIIKEAVDKHKTHADI